MKKDDSPRRRNKNHKTEKKKAAWSKPEITVKKVESPPTWSSCSFGSDSAEDR